MKNRSVVLKSLFALAVMSALPAACVAAGAGGAFKEIAAEADARLKKGAKYRDVVGFLESRLDGEDVRTNAALRVAIDRKILSLCVVPSWLNFRRWDKKWADGHIAGVCEREIAAADCPNADKIHFLHALARRLAGGKDYPASLATAEKALALDGLKPNESFQAHCLVADAFRWADRYAEAKAALREAARFNAVLAAKKLADLAADYGNDADVAAAWTAVEDPYPRLEWYLDRGRADEASADAFAYADDGKNPVSRRRDILIRYFGTGKTDLALKARAIARKMDFGGYFNWRVRDSFSQVYRFGDWKLFAEIAETFALLPWFENEGWYRGYLFSLLASGRGDEVAKKADAFLAKDASRKKPALDPAGRAKFGMLKALAEGKDPIAVAKGARLGDKEFAVAVQTAAQWCLNLRRNEECERYSALYRSLFRKEADRRYTVRFFDRPVSSIAAWRGIAGGLEKSYASIKMCGDLDRLATDVATGRAEIEKTALDSADALMEITAFCDTEGLKIVMRAADANARAVENGFAGGIGTECYFAPGRGEPYICFCSSPKEGVGFVFYTSYSSAYAQRLEFDDMKSPYAMRREIEFTDTDYVLMVTLPWRAFYQKLPESGTEWRFECLANGRSWGGSQGVHESSSWGSLVFDLKPSQIAAIRRRLVYDTYKTWNAAEHGKLTSFARWSDPVTGDPEFYGSSLKKLEEALMAEAAKVKARMSDAEVNEIYEKGAKIWIGLDHEIDARRRTWLLEKFTGR